MICMDAGHAYLLTGNQHLVFMKKEAGQLVYDGTTNEDVIKVLINRLKYLNEAFPCQKNEDAIGALNLALHRLNARTLAREAQGVEGQDLPHVSEG